jgi:hypothetical protein
MTGEVKHLMAVWPVQPQRVRSGVARSPRHLRMDGFLPVLEQIVGLRAGLARWQRQSAELADEVARWGASVSRMGREPGGAKREGDR